MRAVNLLPRTTPQRLRQINPLVLIGVVGAVAATTILAAFFLMVTQASPTSRHNSMRRSRARRDARPASGGHVGTRPSNRRRAPVSWRFQRLW